MATLLPHSTVFTFAACGSHPLRPATPPSLFHASMPRVPESLLKKRKTTEKLVAEREAKAQEAKKANKGKRREIFKRAEIGRAHV